MEFDVPLSSQDEGGIETLIAERGVDGSGWRDGVAELTKQLKSSKLFEFIDISALSYMCDIIYPCSLSKGR